ncbi:MAG: serine/threonine-protein kinase [Planctomycetota bacterium]
MTDRPAPTDPASRPTDTLKSGKENEPLDRALRAAFANLAIGGDTAFVPSTTLPEPDTSASDISEGSRDGTDILATGIMPLPPLPPAQSGDDFSADAVHDLPTRALTRNETSNDRYRVINEVARGGAGAVMRAHDQRLGRDVAMKVLSGQHRSGTMALRFLDEVRIAGQLQHPGVVPIYDQGTRLDGRPFFTMKLVEGKTLSALLKERPNPAADRHRFLRIFEQVCQTIAYAHSRGVVHRDLKPANIMIGQFGEVLVLDWGLARVLREPVSEVEKPVNSLRASVDTAEGGAYGTPAFMPPEQARGKAMDERADVFSLGAVLCQILTGQPPYGGPNPLTLLGKAAAGNLDDVHKSIAGSGADAELVELTVHCLQSDVEKRPRHAGEVAARVSAYLAAVDDRAHVAELEAARQRARAISERRVRRLAVGLALAVVLILAGAVWVSWQRSELQRENDRRAEELLTDASELSGRREWMAAEEVALRAKDIVDTGLTSDVVRQRVQTLLDTCQTAAHRERLLDAIRRVRNEVGIGPAELSRLFTNAFREYGIDLDQEPQVVAQAIRSFDDNTAAALVLALDDWASRIPPHATDDADKQWRHLMQITSYADTDDWRKLLRQAVQSGEVAVLDGLANTVNDEPRPPQNFLLLGQSLDRLFMNWELEIRVLQAGYQQHPDDFWINMTLAHRSGFVPGRGRDPRSIDLCEQHARIAWSLQPDSVEAMVTLALILDRRSKARTARPSDAAESRAMYRLVRTRASDNELVVACADAALLAADGKTAEARAAAIEARQRFERMPPYARSLLDELAR